MKHCSSEAIGNCVAVKLNVIMFIAGRSPDASAELIEKFTQFSLETGIMADNIAILPPNGKFDIISK